LQSFRASGLSEWLRSHPTLASGNPSGSPLGKGGEAAEAIPGRIAMPNTERQFREATENRSTMGERLGVVPERLDCLCPIDIDFTLDIVNIKNKR
jgi:hypothetical protein